MLFRRGELGKQCLLSAEPLCPAACLEMIMAMPIHFPGLPIVLEVNIQTFGKHALFELLFEYRKTYFNTAKKIPIHPVRTGQIDGVRSATAKIKNAAVLKEAANYRAHADIFG